MQNDAFDRLLRRTLRRDGTAAECPDPAVLAAFAENTLTADERRAVEIHASSCARCGAELSVLAATADAAGVPRPAEEPRGFAPWRWAVPLATAVVIFAVWTELDRRGEDRMQPPAAPAASSADRGAAAGSAEETGHRMSDEPSGSAARLGRAAPAPPRMGSERVAQSPQAEPPQDRFQRRDEPREEESARAAPPQEQDASGAAPPAPTSPQRGAPADTEKQDARFRRADETRAANAPERAAEPGTELREMAKEAEPPPALADAGAEAFKAEAIAISFLVHGPGGIRIRSGSSGIERSVDAGATWRVEHEGALSAMRAGVCPTADVCWLGGEDGRVLRREPSGRWVESRLPTRQAVTVIEARNAQSASVTDSDGRRFATTNGGRTWSPLP